MAPVPVGGERGVDQQDLVGGRVRVDGHAGGVDGVLRGPGREELCVVHEPVLHAASERFERIFSAQVAQDARFRGQGGGDGDPGVLVVLGDGKVGVEELGDLDVVGGQPPSCFGRWESGCGRAG